MSVETNNAGAANSSETLLKFLLEEAQCDPWSVDVLGRTPLHIACQRKWTFGIKILQTFMRRVKHGRDPSGEDAPLDLRGWSPVWYTNLYSKQGDKSMEERRVSTPTHWNDHRLLLAENKTPDSAATSSPHRSRLTPSDWIQRPIPTTPNSTTTLLSVGGKDRFMSPRRPFGASGGGGSGGGSFGGSFGGSGGSGLRKKRTFYSDRKSQLSRETTPGGSGGGDDSPSLTPDSPSVHTDSSTSPNSKRMKSSSPVGILSVHHGARMGGRERFEDASVISNLGHKIHVYALFDGHGGDFASNFCSEWLMRTLEEGNVETCLFPPVGGDREVGGGEVDGGGGDGGEDEKRGRGGASSKKKKQKGGGGRISHNVAVARCLTQMCVNLDAKLRATAPAWDKSGCTGLIVLVTSQQVFTCNVGDCRSVLSSTERTERTERTTGSGNSVDNNMVIDLSRDFAAPAVRAGALQTSDVVLHERCSREMERIQRAGGVVQPPDSRSDARVRGSGGTTFEPTRCFGDFHEKNDISSTSGVLTCVPEISIVSRKCDEILILGCDGVWEQVASSEACCVVRSSLAVERKAESFGGVNLPPCSGAEAACESLLSSCLRRAYERGEESWEKGWILRRKRTKKGSGVGGSGGSGSGGDRGEEEEVYDDGTVDVQMVEGESDVPLYVEEGIDVERLRPWVDKEREREEEEVSRREEGEECTSEKTLEEKILEKKILEKTWMEEDTSLIEGGAKRQWVEVRRKRKLGGCDNMSAIVVQLASPVANKAKVVMEKKEDNKRKKKEEKKEEEKKHEEKKAGRLPKDDETKKKKRRRRVTVSDDVPRISAWFDFAHDSARTDMTVERTKQQKQAAAVIEQEIEWESAEPSTEETFFKKVRLTTRLAASYSYRNGDKDFTTFLSDLEKFVRDYDEEKMETTRSEARSKKRTRTTDTQTKGVSSRSKLVASFVALISLLMSMMFIGVAVGRELSKRRGQDSTMTISGWFTHMNNDSSVTVSLLVMVGASSFLWYNINQLLD